MNAVLVEHEGALPFLLALPKARDTAHPVLFFLHGHGEGAPMDLRHALTLHGPLRAGNRVPALERFVIVAPQMPVRGDLWHRHEHAVRAMLSQVVQMQGGDPARAYLTGFSFGGNGVFDLALAQPDTWAALWPVDPTRVPERDPGRPVWLSVGERARQAKDAFIGAMGLHSVLETPDADRVFLDEGEDHVGCATRAYQDERIYRWLLSKRLDDASRSAA